MDSWVRHQVSLEFSDVDIQSTVKSQRSGQGRDSLGDQPVQISVGWSLDIKLSSADVIDSFIVQHDCDVSVF